MIERIGHIFARARPRGRPVLSFEFFPTKTDEGERAFWERTLPALAELEPDFCSVTYGAGGSTRDKTLAIVDRLQRERSITAMAHLTCVNATVEETRRIIHRARDLGILNLLALRGDPPSGITEFVRTDGGFEYSYQLVRCIRELDAFSIGVAGFPEGHIACPEGRHEDWRRLKEKIDHGADFVITQFFFDNVHYLECRDFLAGLGVEVPIVPGILPVVSASQLTRFVSLCGATLPKAMQDQVERWAHDDKALAEFGIEWASRQCEDLLREGAPGLHFYTLNRVRSTTAVVGNLALARATVDT